MHRKKGSKKSVLQLLQALKHFISVYKCMPNWNYFSHNIMISMAKNSKFINNCIASLRKEYDTKLICSNVLVQRSLSNDSRNPNISINVISPMLCNWEIS